MCTSYCCIQFGDISACTAAFLVVTIAFKVMGVDVNQIVTRFMTLSNLTRLVPKQTRLCRLLSKYKIDLTIYIVCMVGQLRRQFVKASLEKVGFQTIFTLV